MAQRVDFQNQGRLVSGDLLNVLSGIFSTRKRRVVLNIQKPSSAKKYAGVPQESIVDALLFFHTSNVSQANSQKHLGVILISKLTFNESLDNVLNKVNKTTGLLCKLLNFMPGKALITSLRQASSGLWQCSVQEDVFNSFHE